jgi:hypothetical protein
MAKSAALIVDEVLTREPMWQWVFSFHMLLLEGVYQGMSGFCG